MAESGREESGATTKQTFKRSRSFCVHDEDVFRIEDEVTMDWFENGAVSFLTDW